MLAREFVGFVVLAAFLVGGYLSFSSSDLVGRLLGGTLGLGVPIWYFARGMYARGWIGPGIEQMRSELAQVDERLKGMSVLDEKWMSTMDRQRELRQILAELDTDSSSPKS